MQLAITIPLMAIAILLGPSILTNILAQGQGQGQGQGQEQKITTASNNNTMINLAVEVNLAVEQLSVGESPTGLVLVTGIVYNNSTINVENVKVEVELFDSNDMLITEKDSFVTPPSSILKPNERRQFEFLINADRVDHHNVIAYGINRN
jgi:hypothetical protein